MLRRDWILGVVGSIPALNWIKLREIEPIARVHISTKSIREKRWDLLEIVFATLEYESQRPIYFPMSRMFDKVGTPHTGITFNVKPKFLNHGKKYVIFNAYDDGSVDIVFDDEPTKHG